MNFTSIAGASDSKIRKFAAGLGLFQGLTWSILSLICIVLHTATIEIATPSTYMENVGYSIYLVFLYYSSEVFTDQSFTGGVFTAFMWVYFSLDILWIYVSIDLLCRDLPKLLKYWSVVTLVLAFLDFLTFVILGADYAKCLDYASLYETGGQRMQLEELCANAILPVFVIAAKGFTLWIFNIFMGVLVFRMHKDPLY